MHPKVEKYQPQLNTLINFVEGRLDGPALDAALATEETKSMLSVFEDARYPHTTNHFRRLHNGQDRTTLGGLVNSEGIIEDFLRKADVDFQAAKRFRNAYSLILQSLPDYLDPPLEFIIENIIPLETDLTDSQKKKLIRERLKENFKYTSKPPKWLQNPEWPIRAGKPLIFVGQITLDASALFHDNGMAYVFYDPTTGDFETIAQFY